MTTIQEVAEKFANEEALRDLLTKHYEKHGLESLLTQVVVVLRKVPAQQVAGQIPAMAEHPVIHATSELDKAIRMERQRRIVDDRPYPF